MRTTRKGVLEFFNMKFNLPQNPAMHITGKFNPGIGKRFVKTLPPDNRGVKALKVLHKWGKESFVSMDAMFARKGLRVDIRRFEENAIDKEASFVSYEATLASGNWQEALYETERLISSACDFRWGFQLHISRDFQKINNICFSGATSKALTPYFILQDLSTEAFMEYYNAPENLSKKIAVELFLSQNIFLLGKRGRPGSTYMSKEQYILFKDYFLGETAVNIPIQ